MSSTKTLTKSSKPSRVTCITDAKVFGAFLSPNGITRNSQWPSSVTNADFSILLSVNFICQNPDSRSMTEYQQFAGIWRKILLQLHIGAAFVFVCALSFL